MKQLDFILILVAAIFTQVTKVHQVANDPGHRTRTHWTLNGKTQSRMTNGMESKLFSRPYQASLQHLERGHGWKHFCGAVIIDHYRLLSAGHCLRMFPFQLVRAVVGSLDLAGSSLEYTQFLKIASLRVHKNFTMTKDYAHNDIGVIYLKTKLVLNKNVQPAIIAPAGIDFDHRECVTAGWGTIGYNGPFSSKLHETTGTKLTDEECRAAHEAFGWPYVRNLICLKGHKSANESVSGICKGDSGGPLVCGRVRKYLVGLTSYSFVGCNSESFCCDVCWM